MPNFRATHKQTGEVAEYSKPLPLPEHLTEGWRLEEVSEAYVAPPDPEAPDDTRMFGGRRELTKLEFVSLLGSGFISILADAKNNVEAEAWVKIVDLATPNAEGHSINLDDPRIEAGLQAFEAQGVVAPGTTERVIHG